MRVSAPVPTSCAFAGKMWRYDVCDHGRGRFTFEITRAGFPIDTNSTSTLLRVRCTRSDLVAFAKVLQSMGIKP